MHRTASHFVATFAGGMLLAATAGPALGSTINVDFGRTPTGGGPGIYSGTGAAPDTGTNWNGIENRSSTLSVSNLEDSNGDPTTVDIAASYRDTTDRSNSQTNNGSDPASALLGDFLRPNPPGSITLSDLGTSAYDLYLYGGSENTSDTTTFTVGGVAKTSGPPSTSTTTLTEGEDYVVYDDVLPDPNGEIAIGFTGDQNHSGVYGLQAVEIIPEPASLVLLGLGGLTLLPSRRKRR